MIQNVGAPSPRQLLLDCNAWLQWRIPYFNSYSYGLAATLASLTTALTAIYFIRSAVRAQRYLSNDGTNENGGGTNVANKAAMRRLMRRVFASGCLMLVITVVLAIATSFIFHPTGFAVFFAVSYLIVMANSLLQIDSFVPASGAPVGPLREAWWAFSRGVHRLVDRGEQWLASSSAAKPNLLVKVAQTRQSRSPSVMDQSGDKMLLSFKRSTEQSGLLSSAIEGSVRPGQNSVRDDEALQNDQLKPWERPGVSIRFVEAFARTHGDTITPDMTTTDVLKRIIKPETAARKCCYIELLASDDRCPPEWLGKPTHFASHW